MIEIKEEKCEGCEVNKASYPHTCPFREEIGKDSTTTCNCCYDCECECARSI